MNNNSKKSEGGTILKYFIGGTIVLIGIMILFGVVTHCVFKGQLASQGQFGDQFGALNSLFSGLAFLGLILTILFQSRDLQTQTRALEMQIKEFQDQKKEMERSAQAQENYNVLTKIMILVEARKMRADVMLKNVELGNNQQGQEKRLKAVSDFVSESMAEIDTRLKEAGMLR